MTGMKLQQYQKGSSNSMVIALVSLGVASVLLIGLSVWLFLQYNEEKNTVDAQIDAAAAESRGVERKKRPWP
jgi:flagellar basal body-associated protein FliL